MYVRNNGDRRHPSEQPKGRNQRPVHISQSRPRDIIPPPDYGGTILYDTVNEAGPVAERETAGENSITFNPRNETQASGGKGGIPASNGDDAALFASSHMPFEEQIREGSINRDSDGSEEDERPLPRRPIISRADYEDPPDNRPDPRYPLEPDAKTDGGAYIEEDTQGEASHPVITHSNGRSYRPTSSSGRKESRSPGSSSAEIPPENKFSLLGFFPPASDDLLLCGLIVLLLLSGSDDELIIILAFLLLAH